MPTSAAPASSPIRAADLPRRHRVMTDTPVGPLTLVAAGDALVAVWMTDQRHRPDASSLGDPAAPDDLVLSLAEQQLREYFSGSRTGFEMTLAPQGTDFQRLVWAALQEIPYGERWSYGELAAYLGRPGASRAVGLANGRNPLGIVVPCHRVVGADGGLTGYGGGIERKRILLELEQGRRQPSLLDDGGGDGQSSTSGTNR